MAFKRTQSPTFKAKVEVNLVKEDGTYEKSDFWAFYARPTTEEREVLLQLPHEEVVRKQIRGWELVDDETKEAVPFLPSELDAVLSVWPTPLAAAGAFWETLNGARAKN